MANATTQKTAHVQQPPPRKTTNFTFMERFEHNMRRLDHYAGSPSSLLTGSMSIPGIGIGLPLPIMLAVLFVSVAIVMFAISKVRQDRSEKRRLWLADITSSRAPNVSEELHRNIDNKWQVGQAIHRDTIKHFATSSSLNPSTTAKAKAQSTRYRHHASLAAALPHSWAALVDRAPAAAKAAIERKVVEPTHQEFEAERERAMREFKSPRQKRR